MDRFIAAFERIARNASKISKPKGAPYFGSHPFTQRNIHNRLPHKVKALFDDGHYSEATFEAFKFIDKTIQKLSKSRETGFKLMMTALNESRPLIRITNLSNASEIDEQEGFKFLFSGGSKAIRNPRGHECNIKDTAETCLDHLAFASLLIRRLEQSDLI